MENGKKQIAILGSTGSIGTQALDVIRERRDLFDVYALAANNHVELLIRQAREFLPDRTSPFTVRYDFVQQPSQCRGDSSPNAGGCSYCSRAGKPPNTEKPAS